jgi:hypothetical protein
MTLVPSSLSSNVSPAPSTAPHSSNAVVPLKYCTVIVFEFVASVLVTVSALTLRTKPEAGAVTTVVVVAVLILLACGGTTVTAPALLSMQAA